MALPNIQLYSLNSRITSVWEVTPGYASYNLYISQTGNPGSFSLISGRIPNRANLGKTLVQYEFLRGDVGYTEANTFFLALEGLDADGVVISPLGPTRIVPSCVDQMVDAGAMNSPITASENKSRIIENVPTQLELSHDVKFLEVFNNTDDETLYVEVSGIPATTTKSMPVYSKVYYTIFRNISKDTGISLISSSQPIDARIIVHY